MRKNKWFFLVVCMFLGLSVKGQTIAYTTKDVEIYYKLEIKIENYNRELSDKELFLEVSRFFLNTPYVASTLEKEPEQLVINLREMDCTTYVENVLALLYTFRDEEPSFNTFANYLQQIRYRNGKIDGYLSRLHYMSDWIYNNQEKGLVKDITKQLGGEVLPLHLSFMSTHPDSYKQLKSSPDLVLQMADIEKRINQRSYYYIPAKELPAKLDVLNEGDIVCFVTSIKGLDVTHVGYIYKTEDEVTFIHASTNGNKVIINKESLVDYVNRIKTTIGVMIVRPVIWNN